MPKKKSNLQTKLEYLVVRGIIAAIGLFPLSFSMKLGEALGRLTKLLSGNLGRVARRNLEIALPELNEKEHQRILRGSFESLGRQLGLVSHFNRLTRENVLRLLEIEGKENIELAQVEKRGIIFFTAHLGVWEFLNLVFGVLGYPLNIIVRRIDNPLLENFVEDLRTKFGSRTIDKRASARVMFRLLQSGGRLGILADLNTQEHEGIFVDFFGIPASTTASLAKLALRTDAVVLPFFAVWQKDKQNFLLKIEPPLEIRKTGNNTEDVKNLTQAVTAVIEKFIRLYPDQWMWIHKRWNTRPEGEKKLY